MSFKLNEIPITGNCYSITSMKFKVCRFQSPRCKPRRKREVGWPKSDGYFEVTLGHWPHPWIYEKRMVAYKL